MNSSRGLTAAQFEAVRAILNEINTEYRDLTVSQWAELNRYMPKGTTSRVGQWDNSVTPYLTEIMDCFDVSSPVREVAFIKSNQIGGTVVAENVVCYYIGEHPCPIMYISSTEPHATDWMQNRMDNALLYSGLQGRIKSQSLDNSLKNKSGSTKRKKEFDGGYLMAVGGQSPNSFRQKSIRVLIFDELDGITLGGAEGSPARLAKNRTDAFTKHKIFYTSTPTVKNASNIEKIYESGDRRRFFIPCLKCGTFQDLVFKPTEDQRKEEGIVGLIYKKHDDGGVIQDSVGYVCKKCGNIWRDEQKRLFLTGGEWRATGTSVKSTLRSYHLNALYSPFYTWWQFAQEFEECKGNQNDLKVFVNTKLGQTWVEKGEGVSSKKILMNRNVISYNEGEIPADVLFVTGGADVHKRWIGLELVGWGRNGHTYSICYKKFEGDTDSGIGSAFAAMGDFLRNCSLKRKDGKHAIFARFVIDVGYNGGAVVDFCRGFGSSQISPCRGEKQAVFKGRDLISVKTAENYPDLLHIDIKVYSFKDIFFANASKSVDVDGQGEYNIPYGFCFFPSKSG